jgi:hypothetical protein
MSTKTAEERAAERFDREASYIELHRGEGYATCIREEVEPLEAEVAKLRALVQELGNALCLIGSNDEHSGSVCEALHHRKGMLHEGYEPCLGIRQINKALESFKEHGFVPTNTPSE